MSRSSAPCLPEAFLKSFTAAKGGPIEEACTAECSSQWPAQLITHVYPKMAVMYRQRLPQANPHIQLTRPVI